LLDAEARRVDGAIDCYFDGWHLHSVRKKARFAAGKTPHAGGEAPSP
jgi:hypothetical protein